MKRKLSLCLAIVLVVSVLCSCVGCGKKDGTGSTASTPVDDSIFSSAKVDFVNADGESVYRIVRPDGDNDVMAIATSVYKSMTTNLGVKIKNVADTDDGSDVYEILVGNTSRAESKQAIQYLRDNGNGRYDDYIICTIGKKIVINGMTLEAIKTASEYFMANYVKKEGVEGGIKYINLTPGEFKTVTINGNNISKYTFIRDLTNRSWLIQDEIGKVQKAIKEKTGFIVELKEDKTTAEGEYEIIVGNTTRPGTKPQAEYGEEEYEILISGKKVYIMGGSTYAVQVAITEFGKLFQKDNITDADSKLGIYSKTIGTYDSASYYRLVWADEFNGDTLENNWYFNNSTNVGNGDGPSVGIKNDETCEVKNGNLIMRGFKNPDGGYTHCNGAESTNFMHFNMGYLEMRARIPDGKGVYSSFWLLNTPVTPDEPLLEIDIFESLGNPGVQQATIHKWGIKDENGNHLVCDSSEGRKFKLKEGSLFDEYRTVGILWNETEVVCYYDGVEYYRHTIDDHYFVDKFLNLKAGFNVGWEGRTRPGDNLEWPVEYHIDYFRLFQIDGQSIRLT